MKKCLFLLLCLLPIAVVAQVSLPYAWSNYIEQLLEEGEDETVEDLMELYDHYCENPINLNDTLTDLPDLPFVNELHQQRLKAYIAQHGSLLSIEELNAINGFDDRTIDLLRPLVKVDVIETGHRLTWKELVRQGRSNLVMGVSGTVEQARGYRDSIYEGNNLRLMWRYNFKVGDRLQLQLSGDKDPGEAFFTGSQQQGFDFYGYSLLLNDVGKYNHSGLPHSFYLRRVIVGQYNLQFGQGLTLWSGFGPRTAYDAHLCRIPQGIRPNGAFSEYGYLHGAAATLAFGRHWELTSFYSNRWLDATLPSVATTDSTVDWVQSIYNSGYHRTATELKKKHQLNEQLYGGHLQYQSPTRRVGLTAMATQLDKSIIPATYAYNDNAFRGSKNFNAGLDFAFHHRRLLWFGEAAVCANHAFDSTMLHISSAALTGVEFSLNNHHRISAILRYYSPTYHNLHASALGQNSTPQNEVGGGLYYQGELSPSLQTTLSAQSFRFPHAKYLAYEPSHGQDYRVALQHISRRIKGLTLGLQYRYRERGRNLIPATLVDGHYPMEQTRRHQAQADLLYSIGSVRVAARLAYAHYRGDQTPAVNGWMFYYDMQYVSRAIPLILAARVALFDVEDYEARLYSVESDFIYQYNSALYQNEGMRLYLVLRYDISRWWSVGVKYSLTTYSDRDTFGSGYELIDGNQRQQWRLQLRLKW